jgi:hypothetical protein
MRYSASLHLLLVGIFCGLAVAHSAGPAQGEELSPAALRLQNDVKYLASDELEGRGLGTRGLQLAAEYIEQTFREAGLNVTAAGGNAFQEFEINDGAKLTEPNSLLLAGPGGLQLELAMGPDFQVCSFGAAGEFSAPVVFAGYGIESEEPAYNDFNGVNLEGKVVIVLRRNPQQSNPHGPFASARGVSRHAALTTKVSRVFSRGAAAIILVNDHFTGANERAELDEQLAKAQRAVLQAAEQLVQQELQGAEAAAIQPIQQQLREAVTHLTSVRDLVARHNPDVLMEFGYAGTRSGRSLPIFHVSRSKIDELLQAAGKPKLEELEEQIDADLQPRSFELPECTIRGQASLEVIRRKIRNVIGVLEGTGPLAKETVVIGAHFDHLGYGEEGSLLPGSKDIHNGADDNASGTAGLLDLARRLGARHKENPLPRRVVFIAFTGEERGLLGSAEYVRNPLFPLEETVAMLNLDMIGRLEQNQLTVFGTGTSTFWEPLLDPAAQRVGLTLIKKPEGFGPSDHASFYGKKIPVLHFFTGIHPDYHRPSDDWQLINATGMDQIVSLTESLAWSAITTPTRPDYIEIAGQAELNRTGNRPYFGSIPNFSTDATGYSISGVAPGSPAEKGGLKGGDVIIQLGEQQIGSLDDFDLALRNYRPGEQITVTVRRGNEVLELKVTLATPRG